nr:ribonuclease H-like domain-containing protein [Tanacetum cinerariifolium]
MVGPVEQPYEHNSIEEKYDRKNEMKARGTLLMALPNKDQLKFHSYQDAELLMEAIEKRYEGNKESKKVQRTLLKQQYENFAASSSKTLDQTFDSLPSEWKTHALIWMNKAEIETISLDDLYNNLKIYEHEFTGSSSTSQNLQNVAFVSSNNTNNTSSTNEPDNTAYGISTAHIQGNSVNSTSVDKLSDAVICAFLASQPNSPQLAREDLEQIDPDDLEEMALKWEMVMLTIRDGIHFARECRALKNQENRGRVYGRQTVPVDNSTKNALIVQDRIRGYDWSNQAEEEHLTNFSLMTLTSLGSSFNSDSK